MMNDYIKIFYHHVKFFLNTFLQETLIVILCIIIRWKIVNVKDNTLKVCSELLTSFNSM